MENKIKRFIELSIEFTADSREIYGESVFSTASSINMWSGVTISLPTPGYQQPPLTRLEQFTKAQQDKAEKVERYEEYLALQTDLLDYYNALTKLK